MACNDPFMSLYHTPYYPVILIKAYIRRYTALQFESELGLVLLSVSCLLSDRPSSQSNLVLDYPSRERNSQDTSALSCLNYPVTLLLGTSYHALVTLLGESLAIFLYVMRLLHCTTQSSPPQPACHCIQATCPL